MCVDSNQAQNGWILSVPHCLRLGHKPGQPEGWLPSGIAPTSWELTWDLTEHQLGRLPVVPALGCRGFLTAWWVPELCAPKGDPVQGFFFLS